MADVLVRRSARSRKQLYSLAEAVEVFMNSDSELELSSEESSAESSSDSESSSSENVTVPTGTLHFYDIQ
jgi:hypothetical protein